MALSRGVMRIIAVIALVNVVAVICFLTFSIERQLQKTAISEAVEEPQTDANDSDDFLIDALLEANIDKIDQSVLAPVPPEQKTNDPYDYDDLADSDDTNYSADSQDSDHSDDSSGSVDDEIKELDDWIKKAQLEEAKSMNGYEENDINGNLTTTVQP